MANFLAIVDPDSNRRAAWLANGQPMLDVVPGLRHGRCESGAFATIWAASESAPISQCCDDAGAGIIWGEAIEDNGARVTAECIRERWCAAGLQAWPLRAWNGFHAALAYDSRDSVVVGADLFGTLPVYYWSTHDVLLVGSSAAAFAKHRAFHGGFDALGLTGILLTGGLHSDDTLQKGVRRLAPGQLMVWSPHRGVRLLAQQVVPMMETLGKVPFEEHVAMLDEALDRCIDRHVKAGQRHGLLLSGGRDSRVVAGLLHRHRIATHALTLGEPRDYEVRIGASVANTLDFLHTAVPDPLQEVETMVRRHIEVEQLSNGMANCYTWGMIPLLAVCGTRVSSGYWMEDFIGGTARQLPQDGTDAADPFARVLRKTMSYGLGLTCLRRLVKPDVFGDSIACCIERMRDQFAVDGLDDDRRAWLFDISHRGRHHAGSTPWRMSFGAWPTLLALDQPLVALCAALPKTTVLARRAEDKLLQSRFPELAALPLDRNSDVLDPLSPSRAWQLRRFMRERIPFAARLRSAYLAARGERRRYFRLYDINSPFWRRVREVAEEGRGRASEVLDKTELNRLLPPPSTRIQLRDPITDSNGLKALLGFLIWWRERA